MSKGFFGGGFIGYQKQRQAVALTKVHAPQPKEVKHEDVDDLTKEIKIFNISDKRPKKFAPEWLLGEYRKGLKQLETQSRTLLSQKISLIEELKNKQHVDKSKLEQFQQLEENLAKQKTEFDQKTQEREAVLRKVEEGLRTKDEEKLQLETALKGLQNQVIELEEEKKQQIKEFGNQIAESEKAKGSALEKVRNAEIAKKGTSLEIRRLQTDNTELKKKLDSSTETHRFVKKNLEDLKLEKKKLEERAIELEKEKEREVALAKEVLREEYESESKSIADLESKLEQMTRERNSLFNDDLGVVLAFKEGTEKATKELKEEQKKAQQLETDKQILQKLLGDEKLERDRALRQGLIEKEKAQRFNDQAQRMNQEAHKAALERQKIESQFEKEKKKTLETEKKIADLQDQIQKAAGGDKKCVETARKMVSELDGIFIQAKDREQKAIQESIIRNNPKAKAKEVLAAWKTENDLLERTYLQVLGKFQDLSGKTPVIQPEASPSGPKKLIAGYRPY